MDTIKKYLIIGTISVVVPIIISSAVVYINYINYKIQLKEMREQVAEDIKNSCIDRFTILVKKYNRDSNNPKSKAIELCTDQYPFLFKKEK